MDNAAVIIFKKSILPGILKFFAVPRINLIFEAGEDEDKVRVHIIECPVMENPADNKRVGKYLWNMCRENNISFFIGRNIEYYLGSGLEPIENIVERSGIEEAQGIKDLSALIKLSADKNINLLNKNMGFIREHCSYQYISIIAEEAAGVIIYEHDKIDETDKKAVFERLMAEKGISAVFTKDLSRLVSQCDVILADESVKLEAVAEKLSGKILIGSSAVSGDFEKAGQVLLWYDSLDNIASDNVIIRFNSEILGILRHFYSEKSTISFIRRFPHIYLNRGNESGMFPHPQGTLTNT